MRVISDKLTLPDVTGLVAGGATQTYPIYTIPKGFRVTSASAKVLTPGATATDSTMALQDANTVAYLAATNTTLDNNPAGTLIDCAGAAFNQSGGKLYTAATALNAVFTKGATPGLVNPVWRFQITLRREFPA